MKPARDYDPARPCQLDSEKWRVRRYVVPVPKQAAVARPWQLQSPAPAPPHTVEVAVWGVWPPQWHIDGAPMLVYPVWRQAFRSAWDRAQFAYAPQQPTHVYPAYQPQFDEDING